MRENLLTVVQATKVYRTLEEYVGAPMGERDNFIHHATQVGITEWRFGGLLGFGGKFWINNRQWYVNCYPEDENDARLALIAKCNEKLEALCSAVH